MCVYSVHILFTYCSASGSNNLQSEKIYNLDPRLSLNIKSLGGKFDENVGIFTWLEATDRSSRAPPPPGAER